MHAWVSYTSADTHGCRLHQEPLDLLPGVFQAQTLRHKLQRLERVIFLRSLLYLHSCPKRAPCSSLCGFEALTLQADFKWFQTITKLIRRDTFSANISLPSFHKNWSLMVDGKSCTAGIERTEPRPCPSNFALRSIDCVRFRVKARV